MRILLITTSPNNVLGRLKTMSNIDLSVIDLNGNNVDIGGRIREVASSINLDMIITYRCPYILPMDIFTIPSIGAYNIHPSLLPKYSGLNPWDEFIKNRETQTGVTFHKIIEEIDKGEVVLQKSFTINSFDNIGIVREKTDELAADMLDYFFVFYGQCDIKHIEENEREKNRSISHLIP